MSRKLILRSHQIVKIDFIRVQIYQGGILIKQIFKPMLRNRHKLSRLPSVRQRFVYF
jgi:hypothetical protein